MSAAIKILPSQLIDQIAAGEVVERPASVVKELVENSLDSGASRIVVQIAKGGRDLIKVSDDGRGMSSDDLEMAVVRHATSKLRTFDDLQAISTLGFRGEALPSIAAVSRLTISTRRTEDAAGSRLSLEGGESDGLSEVGAAVGTVVEVADLFFNTPARRKFLRTPPTEMGHISGWLTHLALVRPDVHIRLEHNGRKVMDAPGTSDLAQRVAAVLGREAFEHLYPVHLDTPGIQVSGLVSAPAYSRTNTRGIHLFINGRFVRDRMLQYAIMDAYRTVLPDRRFPLVVLRLDLEPDLVDVNVHPQKTEVRFVDARKVQGVLAAAISDTLAASPWMDLGTQALEQPVARSYKLDASAPPASADAQVQAGRVRDALARYHGGRSGGGTSRRGLPPMNGQTESLLQASGGIAVAGDGSTGEGTSGRPLFDWQLVGTLWNTYIMLADGQHLALIDQHAAHERITFERLRQSLDRDRVRAQRLLVPVQVELDQAACAVVEQEQERLDALGFELEPFGPCVMSVRAVPALLKDAPVAELLRDLLDELIDVGQADSWEEKRLAVLSRMACHSSVRAGQALSEPEVRALLRKLAEVDFAGQCPHGRPVMVQYKRSEVEHWFLRT